MWSLIDLFCCLPVLLMWLAPAAILLFCVGFGGCSRLGRWLRAPRLSGPAA
jgi:hypothetical protein